MPQPMECRTPRFGSLHFARPCRASTASCASRPLSPRFRHQQGCVRKKCARSGNLI